jgi:hypothetical protein
MKQLNNMNKIKRIIVVLSFIISLTIPLSLLSHDVPPPPASHGSDGNQESRGAPVDSGFLILLGFGSIYGGFKCYKLYQEKKNCLLE